MKRIQEHKKRKPVLPVLAWRKPRQAGQHNNSDVAELCTSKTRLAKDEMSTGEAERMAVLSKNNSKTGKETPQEQKKRKPV